MKLTQNEVSSLALVLVMMLDSTVAVDRALTPSVLALAARSEGLSQGIAMVYDGITRVFDGIESCVAALENA